MIYIKRSTKTKQYHVVYTGDNGEILTVSEPLKSKQSAWKNILALMNSNFMQQPLVSVVDGQTPWMLPWNGKKYEGTFKIEPCNLEL